MRRSGKRVRRRERRERREMREMKRTARMERRERRERKERRKERRDNGDERYPDRGLNRRTVDTCLRHFRTQCRSVDEVPPRFADYIALSSTLTGHRCFQGTCFEDTPKNLVTHLDQAEIRTDSCELHHFYRWRFIPPCTCVLK